VGALTELCGPLVATALLLSPGRVFRVRQPDAAPPAPAVDSPPTLTPTLTCPWEEKADVCKDVGHETFLHLHIFTIKINSYFQMQIPHFSRHGSLQNFIAILLPFPIPALLLSMSKVHFTGQE